MTFRYQNDASLLPADSTVQRVKPSVIAYTGYGNTVGNREVRFTYSARTDPSVRYFQGAAGWSIDERLERITTFVNGAPVKNYRLKYKEQAASQIESIKECQGDAETPCKKPTQFTYKAETGFTPGFYLGNISAAVQLDANGDGIADFFETTKTINGIKAHPEYTAISYSADAALLMLTMSGAFSGGVGTAVSGLYMVIKPIVFALLAEDPEIRYKRTMYLGTGLRSPFLETAVGVGDRPFKAGSGGT